VPRRGFEPQLLSQRFFVLVVLLPPIIAAADQPLEFSEENTNFWKRIQIRQAKVPRASEPDLTAVRIAPARQHAIFPPSAGSRWPRFAFWR